MRRGLLSSALEASPDVGCSRRGSSKDNNKTREWLSRRTCSSLTTTTIKRKQKRDEYRRIRAPSTGRKTEKNRLRLRVIRGRDQKFGYTLQLRLRKLRLVCLPFVSVGPHEICKSSLHTSRNRLWIVNTVCKSNQH